MHGAHTHTLSLSLAGNAHNHTDLANTHTAVFHVIFARGAINAINTGAIILLLIQAP